MLMLMPERIQLLAAIKEAKRLSRKVAIASLIRVRGSAYRREGSKMLIDELGNQVCMISGGCLEAEVANIAQEVLKTASPIVHSFDLDEDIVWGLGLACGGSIDIYIEPLDQSELYAMWLESLEQRRLACLITIISGTLAYSRLYVDGLGNKIGQLSDASLEDTLVQIAKEMMQRSSPRAFTKTFTSTKQSVEVFFDISQPASRLILFGAGHDAAPVARYGHELGFEVTIVDVRPDYLTEKRFPNAQLVRCRSKDYPSKVLVGPTSNIVIMNHHFERDCESFAFAIKTQAPYIGVLGPHKRFQEILSAITYPVSDEELKRVYNPIGLDIGSETPEEIAMSLMAELLAIRKGYAAGFLRDRKGPIHRLDDR